MDRYPWRPTGTVTRVRVRAYTCDCAPVVYELCAARGHTYVYLTGTDVGVTEHFRFRQELAEEYRYDW